MAGLGRVLLAGGALAAALAPLAELLANLDGAALLLGLAAAAALGAVIYGAALMLLWSLAGRPQGIEAVLIEFLRDMLRRLTGTPPIRP